MVCCSRKISGNLRTLTKINNRSATYRISHDLEVSGEPVMIEIGKLVFHH